MKVLDSFLISISLLLLSILAPTVLFADGGVGIMPSKIEVDELLSPGSYKVLPTLQVFNTGDQSARYVVQVTSLQEQTEVRAGSDYFAFYPGVFTLDPGGNQIITLSLNIPVDAEPGDYLGLIEAHPQDTGKMVDISIAAASRIYFTVKPANFMQAAWVGVNSFFERHAPLSYIVPLVLLVVCLFVLLRRNLKIELKIARRRSREN